jgi:hypothetical protein
LIKNCAQFNLGNNANSSNCEWAPNANEPAGGYGVEVWQEQSNGTYSEVGIFYASVHS